MPPPQVCGDLGASIVQFTPEIIGKFIVFLTLIYTIAYRIINTMKVTALIPDPLIQELRALAPGKTLTESLMFALTEWRDQKKLLHLNAQLKKSPLKFQDGFSAEKLRELNRQA